MPRKSSKTTEPEWHTAICTQCLSRRINKRSRDVSFDHFMELAKKKGWKWRYDAMSRTLTFICPDCLKEYDFEDT